MSREIRSLQRLIYINRCLFGHIVHFFRAIYIDIIINQTIRFSAKTKQNKTFITKFNFILFKNNFFLNAADTLQSVNTEGECFSPSPIRFAVHHVLF